MSTQSFIDGKIPLYKFYFFFAELNLDFSKTSTQSLINETPGYYSLILSILFILILVGKSSMG